MNIPREAPVRRVNPHKDRTGSWEPSRWSLPTCLHGRVQLPFGWASSQWGKVSFSHQDGLRRSTNCCNQLINKVTTTDEGFTLKINMCSTNCGVKCTHDICAESGFFTSVPHNVKILWGQRIWVTVQTRGGDKASGWMRLSNYLTSFCDTFAKICGVCHLLPLSHNVFFSMAVKCYNIDKTLSSTTIRSNIQYV